MQTMDQEEVAQPSPGRAAARSPYSSAGNIWLRARRQEDVWVVAASQHRPNIRTAIGHSASPRVVGLCRSRVGGRQRHVVVSDEDPSLPAARWTEVVSAAGPHRRSPQASPRRTEREAKGGGRRSARDNQFAVSDDRRSAVATGDSEQLPKRAADLALPFHHPWKTSGFES